MNDLLPLLTAGRKERDTQREEAGQIDPEKSKKIYTRLKNEKARVAFQEWMENVKEKADILIDKTLL